MASESSQKIRAAVIGVLAKQNEFSADDLDLPGIPVNAVGPTIQRMAAEGVIVDTKRTVNSIRPQTKGRLLRVFRRGPFLNGGNSSQGEIFKQLSRTREALEELGFNYDMSILAKLLLALDARPFLILSGISGIGKSSIVRLLAAAARARFVLEVVMPQWTDPTEIMGYYDISLKTFTPGTFIEALHSLASGSESRVFYLLDEMNLAHVEYYLSPYLSVGQMSGEKIVPFVPNVPERDSILENYSSEVPDGFYLFGAINVDETTKTLSSKVLDRAFIMEINDFEFSMDAPTATSAEIKAKLAGLLDLLPRHEAFTSEAQARQAEMRDFLEAIYTILRPINRHFGNRIMQDCTRIVAQWHDCQLEPALSMSQIVDFVVMSRIMPKLQGTSNDLKALRKLRDHLNGITEFNANSGADPLELPDSLARLDAMIAQADLMQIYSFWG